jgi:hypothetical protein
MEQWLFLGERLLRYNEMPNTAPPRDRRRSPVADERRGHYETNV